MEKASLEQLEYCFGAGHEEEFSSSVQCGCPEDRLLVNSLRSEILLPRTTLEILSTSSINTRNSKRMQKERSYQACQ